MKKLGKVGQNVERVKFLWGKCIFRGQGNMCDYYGGNCRLECRLYKFVIVDVKNLLDSEAKKDTMTVHPKEKIVSAIVAGDAIIAQSLDGKVIGFVYLVCWDKHVEIAGLVIKKNFRQHGLGRKLFNEILSLASARYGEKQIIFFANDVSKKLGEKQGFSSLPEFLMDPEFQELCRDCTKEYKKPYGCRCRVMMK